MVVEGPESNAAAAFVEVVRVFDRLGLDRAGAVGAAPELGAVHLCSALGAADPVSEVGQVGRLGLAVNTVGRAYRELEAGLIETRGRAGSFASAAGALFNWLRQADIDAGAGSGTTGSESAELREGVC